MTPLRRWSRRLAAPLRTAALTLTVALGLTATPARAQNEPPPAPEEESKGRSGDGYIATGCLAGLALFIIAKSAAGRWGGKAPGWRRCCRLLTVSRPGCSMPVTNTALDREQVAALYRTPVLDLISRAAEVHRRHHAADEVQVCVLLSVKTGGCPEDCGYCPQSAHYHDRRQAAGRCWTSRRSSPPLGSARRRRGHAILHGSGLARGRATAPSSTACSR